MALGRLKEGAKYCSAGSVVSGGEFQKALILESLPLPNGTGNFMEFQPLLSKIVGFVVGFQSILSIIVSMFLEFCPGCICPRTGKGTPKDSQRESKGTNKEPKVGPNQAKGTKLSS